MNERLRGYRRQIARFVGVYVALVSRILRIASPLIILVVPILGLVGVTAYVGVFQLLAHFVAKTQGKAEGYFATIFPEDPMQALAVLAGIVFVLLLAAAISQYVSAVLSRRVGRQTQVHLIRRTVLSLGALEHLERHSDAPPLDTIRLMKHFNRDTMQCGVAAECLIGMLPTAVHIVAAGAILLYLEPWITAGLFFVVLLTVPLLYLVSRKIMHNADTFYSHDVRQRALKIRELLTTFDTTTLLKPTPEQAARLTNSDRIQAYLNSFDFNQLASPKLTVVTSSILALAVSGGILVFGWLVLGNQREWSTLVVYIGSLLVLVRGLQTFMGQFATLNRLYPQIRSLLKLHDATGEIAARATTNAPEAPAKLVFKIEPRMDKSLSRLEIDKGSAVALILPGHPRRHAFGKITSPLVKACRGHATIWHEADLLAQSLDFAELPPLKGLLVGGREQYAETILAGWRDFIAAYGGDNPDLARIAEKPEEPIPQTLSNRARNLLSLATAMSASKASVLLVGRGLFPRLGPDALSRLLATPLAPYCVILARPNDVIDAFPGDLPVLVSEGDEIIGMGDLNWWQDARQAYHGDDGSGADDDSLDDELFM